MVSKLELLYISFPILDELLRPKQPFVFLIYLSDLLAWTGILLQQDNGKFLSEAYVLIIGLNVGNPGYQVSWGFVL